MEPTRAKPAVWVLVWMTFLFFIWGFLTEMDGALIPFLRDLFELNNFQAALVQFSFFLAFFLFSFPAAKILEKLGYRLGIALGLGVMALGSFGFLLAGASGLYVFFLLAIFTLASGVTLLQVAANPYMVALGGKAKGSNYLNVAQGFNALAKVLAPLFGAWAILDGMELLLIDLRIEQLNQVYLWIGVILAVVALLFWWVKLPEVIPSEETDAQVDHSKSYRDFPHLICGAVAVFLYVGVEVCVATFLVLYLGDLEGLSRAEAATYLSYYWGLLMVGRLLIPLFFPKMPAQKVLVRFAQGAGLCMLVAGLNLPTWSGLALVAAGFFHSIMWGNLFALSLHGLEGFTSKGSGLLVMAIVGGAVLPPLQGIVADYFGLGSSYLMLLPAYGYLIWFGKKGHKSQMQAA